MDPFDTLGVEARFDLDEQALAARQRELSLSLHPDRHAGRSTAERRAALGKAIEVNEAYRTLKNPISRAQALLERWGMAAPEGQEPRASNELLMEMMELREELREAGGKKDAGRVNALLENVREKQRATLVQLSGAISALGQSPSKGSTETLKHVAALRYFRRFSDEAEAYLDEWG